FHAFRTGRRICTACRLEFGPYCASQFLGVPEKVKVEHTGAANSVMFESIERLVCLAKGKDLHLSMDRNLGGNAEKIAAILASVVGDALDGALFIEQLIIKAGNRAHVDSAKDEGSAFSQGLKSRRDQLACGRKNDGRIQLFWRLFCCATGPYSPKFRG